MVSLISTIAKKHGRIDILVNTVGGYLGGKSVVQLEEEEWNKMFGINLLSAFLITKHVLPLMLQSGYGRIVHISSFTGISALGLDSSLCLIESRPDKICGIRFKRGEGL